MESDGEKVVKIIAMALWLEGVEGCDRLARTALDAIEDAGGPSEAEIDALIKGESRVLTVQQYDDILNTPPFHDL